MRHFTHAENDWLARRAAMITREGRLPPLAARRRAVQELFELKAEPKVVLFDVRRGRLTIGGGQRGR